MFAGVEAGGTKFVVAVGNGPDDLTEVVSFPTTAPGATLEHTVAAIRALTGGAAPEAIGVAAFGPVDLHETSPTYGHIAATPKPGWSGADLVGPLATAFGVPIALDTDVTGAALGETTWGASQGLSSSVYVTVGTGIGGGAVVGGRPLRGLVHPEMGHLLVRRHPDDDFAGVCPFHGDCLEGLAAGPAIEQRWGRAGRDLGDLREPAVAIEAFYLGQLAAAVTLVLSPERIVLGGGVMKIPGLLEEVRDRCQGLLAGYVHADALEEGIDDYLVPPGLGDRAGVLGAIALARGVAGAGSSASI